MATIRKFRIVRQEGQRQVARQIDHYSLDEFLAFNDRAVLTSKGTVSKADADAKARAAYKAFADRRRALLEPDGRRRVIHPWHLKCHESRCIPYLAMIQPTFEIAGESVGAIVSLLNRW